MEASRARSDLTLLVFEVDGHRYAIQAADVRELIRAALPTRLAQAPDVIEGVLNVRGQIASVLDLRARFGLARRPLSASDVLILCEVGTRLLALRADAIVSTLEVSATRLTEARDVSPTSVYARGVIALQDGLLLIADVRAFLDEAEQALLTRAVAALERHEGAP